jgi:hypothetical protein
LQALEKQHENVVFEKDELQEELAEIIQIKNVSLQLHVLHTPYGILHAIVYFKAPGHL